MDVKIDDAIACKTTQVALYIKKHSNNLLQTLSSDELNSFFHDIKLSGTKPAILSLIPGFCSEYVPTVLSESTL